MGLRSLLACEKPALEFYFGDLLNIDNFSFASSKMVVPYGLAAITFGNTMFVSPPSDMPGSNKTIALIGHQLNHAYQQKVLGVAWFIQQYLMEFQRNIGPRFSSDAAHHRMPFEVAAYNMGSRIQRHLNGTGGNSRDCSK